MPTTLFDNFGTLNSYMDMNSMLIGGYNFVNAIVISMMYSSSYAPVYVVYGANIMAVCMAFVSAGYVAVHTVDAGISFSRGFYATFGKWSGYTEGIGALEFLLVFFWELWAVLVILLTLLGAGNVWYQMDERLAEIDANRNGLETPLQWDKAIKSVTLCLLIGLMTMVAGYSLGVTADELISYFGEYDNDTIDGTNKDDGKKIDLDGQGALYDFLFHTTVALYAWFVFTVILLGSHLMHIIFWTLDDDFTCDIVGGDYSAVDALMNNMTTKEKCLENVEAAFKLVDKDGDHIISRCEDASYQVFRGSTKEYAFKYSTSWTMASALQLCNDMH